MPCIFSGILMQADLMSLIGFFSSSITIVTSSVLSPAVFMQTPQSSYSKASSLVDLFVGRFHYCWKFHGTSMSCICLIEHSLI